MGFLICKFYLLNLLYRLLDRFRKYSCYISIQTQLVLEKTSIWWHDTCIQNFQEWFYLHNGKLGSSSLQHSNGLWWQQYGYHLLISIPKPTIPFLSPATDKTKKLAILPFAVFNETLFHDQWTYI